MAGPDPDTGTCVECGKPDCYVSARVPPTDADYEAFYAEVPDDPNDRPCCPACVGGDHTHCPTESRR